METVRQSDIVLSLAGHDSGKLYVVTGAEGGYARLADGKVRRLRNPKKKKLRHLEKRSDSPLAEAFRRGTVTDSDIRRILAIYRNVAK